MFPRERGAVIASIMELDRDQIREWLHTALERSRETPTGLARKAGLAQSTLTRFLNTEDSPTLSLRSIAKIAHAAGIEPPGIAATVTTTLVLPRTYRGFSAGEAAPYHASRPETSFDAAVKALIGERNAADAWELSSSAMALAGYLPGDIVIVDLNGQARAGDIVCAQAYRWNEGRAETVFRIYEPPYLISASNDPSARKPLLVDNDRVIIKGVVIGMLRRPLSSSAAPHEPGS